MVTLPEIFNDSVFISIQESPNNHLERFVWEGGFSTRNFIFVFVSPCLPTPPSTDFKAQARFSWHSMG